MEEKNRLKEEKKRIKAEAEERKVNAAAETRLSQLRKRKSDSVGTASVPAATTIPGKCRCAGDEHRYRGAQDILCCAH